jgi:hypothetical protein
VLLCEASRTPSCSNVIVNVDNIAKGECSRAYGSGLQCCPNECIFGSGKPWGVGILDGGVYEPGEGNGEVSLRATWERGGRILSRLGGFQVSREGEKGEQWGAKGSKEESARGRKGTCRAHKLCSRPCI